MPWSLQSGAPGSYLVIEALPFQRSIGVAVPGGMPVLPTVQAVAAEVAATPVSTLSPVGLVAAEPVHDRGGGPLFGLGVARGISVYSRHPAQLEGIDGLEVVPVTLPRLAGQR